MLYIRSLEVTLFITGSSFPLTNISSLPPPSSPWQPVIYTMFLFVQLSYDSTSEIIQYVIFFLIAGNDVLSKRTPVDKPLVMW